MSVLEITLSPRAQALRTRVEEFCKKRNIPAPEMKIELNAGAVTDAIEAIKGILSRIALDEDVADDAKEDLSGFLAQVSLQLKRIVSGSGQRQTGMTAARVTQGHALQGGLQGVRTVIPKSDRVQAGSIEISDGNDITLTIDDVVKVG